MYKSKFRNRAIAWLLAFLAVFALAAVGTVGTQEAFAIGGSSSSSDSSTAQSELRAYALKTLAGNKYEMDGGGYSQGADLFTNQDGTIDVDTTAYSKLSKTGQQKFTDDLVAAMNKASTSDTKQQAANNTTNVTQETTENWLKSLQSNPGMGTRILQQTLGQVKPDFVTANRIFAPFASPIGVIIAFLSIVMMAAVSLTLVLDLCYLVIPFCGGMVKDGKSRLVSDEAIAAKKSNTEGSDGGSGVGKSTLMTYLKSKILSLLLLGFCLVLMVQGQIITFVGTTIDLTEGLF